MRNNSRGRGSNRPRQQAAAAAGGAAVTGSRQLQPHRPGSARAGGPRGRAPRRAPPRRPPSPASPPPPACPAAQQQQQQEQEQRQRRQQMKRMLMTCLSVHIRHQSAFWGDALAAPKAEPPPAYSAPPRPARLPVRSAQSRAPLRLSAQSPPGLGDGVEEKGCCGKGLLWKDHTLLGRTGGAVLLSSAPAAAPASPLQRSLGPPSREQRCLPDPLACPPSRREAGQRSQGCGGVHPCPAHSYETVPSRKQVQ